MRVGSKGGEISVGMTLIQHLARILPKQDGLRRSVGLFLCGPPLLCPEDSVSSSVGEWPPGHSLLYSFPYHTSEALLLLGGSQVLRCCLFSVIRLYFCFLG